MKADHDLVRAADESFIASFRKLAQHVAQGETHEAASIFSFTTGLPLSGFNGCVVTQEASSAELAASLAWVAARAVPFRVWVAEKLAAGLAEVPAGYGLEPAASLYPGMVPHPIPDAPTSSAGVSVVQIFEPSLDEFIGVLEESGLHAELAHRLIIDSKMGGLAVHIGARVAATAAPGQVLVSSTVKDLVAGSEISFEDRGEHELKGVPGTWSLYAVVPA
jgi:hypothetical protein